MPYKNILWIKLEKRLLNDARFFLMSEKSQLIYIKMLLISAETENKIPKNVLILKELFRTKLNKKEVERSLKEIQKNFPKFKKSASNYYFEEWENRVNWVSNSGTPKEIHGNSQGTPKDGADKNRLDKIRREKNIPSFKKPSYDGMNVVFSKGKLWCIPANGGQWLECMAKDSEIIWK